MLKLRSSYVSTPAKLVLRRTVSSSLRAKMTLPAQITPSRPIVYEFLSVSDAGYKVRVWTTTGNPKYVESLGLPKEKIPAELYAAFEGVQDSERGDHTLIGPMYVNGAEPGDTLEIRILAVDVWLPIAAQSFRPHRGVLPEEFPYAKDRVLWIDLNKKTIEC